MNRHANIEIMKRSSGELNINRINVYNHSSISINIKQLLKYLGPAFIVSVAYIDPGNFGTNISGGSIFNYNLIWVILWSNIMAIFLQSLSAKLGIATGASLPEMCGRIFPRKVNCFLWVIAIVAAMATTLAELMGGALGLYLLFRIPMAYSGILIGALAYFIINMEKYGQRAVEFIITALVAVISICYSLEMFLAKPDWAEIGAHMLIPSLPDGQAVLIATGMLGATVMPHVIYLHSQLVQCRNNCENDEKKVKHYLLEKIDITIAMNIAFIVNAAMVIVSASVFYSKGIAVESIEQAHKSLMPLLGSLSCYAFATALLASGLSSAAVGALAGDAIMDGFINLKIPLTIKRLITIIPAVIIISLGINPMKALVISQVVLSFALPAATIPLILITGCRDVMGVFVNKPLTKLAGWLITVLIAGLNAVLLYLTFTGNVG